MADLFKQHIVRYLDTDGKRVKAGTPGARRVEEESRKWYGEYRDHEGTLQRVPLSADKQAARVMLADLTREAELARRGLADPVREAQARRPLAEHVLDFRRHLEAKGDEPKHAADTAARLRRVFDACRFAVAADLAPAAVVEYLGALLRQTPALPPLDPAKEWWTRKELAALLGIQAGAVTALVTRHRLPAEGNGKRRRYPKETAVFLYSSAAAPVGPRTVNAYLTSLKSFAHWLVRDRRLPSDPLAGLTRWNEAEDVRHARRALPPAELVGLLQAALASPKEFRDLTGRDRHFLYLCAMGTGFRAGELASLTPASFALDASCDKTPTVVCKAGYAKNGKTATQPLPAEIAEALAGYLTGRPPRQPVWPGSWHERAADMLRLDLDAAGIPYEVEGPDGPLFADFHALRHSYVALLDRAGLTLKQAMQLARHSDPKLTMNVYGKAALCDLGAALDRLPGLTGSTQPDSTSTAALRLTGTDSAPAESALVTGRVTRLAAVPGRDVSQAVGVGVSAEEGQESSKPPVSQGFDASCRELSSVVGSAPCRTRTYNPLIKSQLLCQLS